MSIELRRKFAPVDFLSSSYALKSNCFYIFLKTTLLVCSLERKNDEISPSLKFSKHTHPTSS